MTTTLRRRYLLAATRNLHRAAGVSDKAHAPVFEFCGGHAPPTELFAFRLCLRNRRAAAEVDQLRKRQRGRRRGRGSDGKQHAEGNTDHDIGLARWPPA
jgi:hypothetical protein